MKKSLKKIVLGTALALALAFTGCDKERAKDERLPEPKSNQILILHPDYLNGFSSLGYTLLSDLDGDGRWDVARRVHIGLSPGDASNKYFFKKGYGPSQSVYGSTVEFVDPEFFRICE